jgi:hypothetical protein
MDGGTSASDVTIVDADQFIVNDNGTMKQVAATKVAAYTAPSTTYGDVGTYVFATLNSTNGFIVPGSTHAGSTLNPASTDSAQGVGDALSGTWQAMGYAGGRNGFKPTTLFVRVS